MLVIVRSVRVERMILRSSWKLGNAGGSRNTRILMNDERLIGLLDFVNVAYVTVIFLCSSQYYGFCVS